MATLRLATSGKQTGAVTMTTETTSVTESITPVDITKSIILASYRGAVDAPQTSSFRWYFSSLDGNNSGEITFQRNADDGSNNNVDFEWQVLTFATGLTAQHFQFSDVDDTETQSITAVDLATSFIIGMGCTKGGTGFSADDMVQIRFASTTSVEFAFAAGSTPTDFNSSFTVVDIDDAEVQFSDHSISASTVNNFSEVFTSIGDSSHAIVFSTCSTTASAIFFDDLLWTCRLISDDTVDFDRGNTTSVTFDFSTFLVNFPQADVLVDHGYTTLASGGDTDVDISLVLSFTSASAMAVYAGGCANGWPHPNGALNQSNWNNYFCALTVVDTATINSRRDSGASNTSNLAWWVIEFTVESGSGQTASPTFVGTGTLATVFSVNVPLAPTMAGTGTLSIVTDVDVAFSPTFSGVGTLVLVTDVDVPFAPTFVGSGTLVVTSSVSGESMAPTFVGTGTLAIVTAVDVPASATFSGVGTLTLSATVAEAVTTKQIFGRFVVVDIGSLDEMALRKIAYVRQRER